MKRGPRPGSRAPAGAGAAPGEAPVLGRVLEAVDSIAGEVARTPRLADLLPAFAHLADVLRVIDLPSSTGGQVMQVLMNGESEEAIAFLTEPTGRDRPQRQ